MAATTNVADTFPSALTDEEQTFIADLKAKYANRSGKDANAFTAAQPAQPAMPPPPPTASAASTAAAVKLCLSCCGQGATTEWYEERSIQRACLTCHGLGTVRKQSEDRVEGSCLQAPASQSLTARIEGYARELQEQHGALEACTDEHGRTLRRELIKQLERHLARLTQRRSQPGAT
jgi:hypothetical protein